MTKILLPDKVRQLTDDEVQTADPTLMGTFQDLAAALNYLNVYARTVLPWHQWGTEQAAIEFVYPSTGGNYAQRQLGVMIAVSPAESGVEAPVTISLGSSSGSGNTVVIQSFNAASAWLKGSEAEVQLYYLDVGFIPDSRELISVTTDLAFNQIVGVGAWELPPTGSGANPMSGPGLTIGSASIDPALDAVILDPSDFLSDDLIDAAQMAEIQVSSAAAWEHNRRIIFWGEFEGDIAYLDPAGVGGHVVNTAYSYPTGGIACPPYAYSKEQETAASRNLRAVVKVIVTNDDVELRWNTSIGTTPWQTLVPGTYWWPTWDFIGGVFDRTVDGIQISVGFVFEWIYLELRTAAATAICSVTSAVIWEDES